jgi:IS30 family transposase
VRQYFPRRTDLAGYSQNGLDAVAAELNEPGPSFTSQV